MEWIVLGDWNTTSLPLVWNSVVDRVWEETESLSKIQFDKITLPAGQGLLHHAELAAFSI